MSQKKSAGSLPPKDALRREFILSGNLWQVIPAICFPLALYQGANHLFKVLDNLMASHIGAGSVSAVAYLTQISQMILALGGGLAVGGSIRIARFYGAGLYEKVKTAVNSLFMLTFLVGLAVLCLVPFTDSLLRFFGTPPELIEIGREYFIIVLFEVVLVFFNNIYISVERARGNSRRILYLNLGCICIKLALTAFFVYVLRSGIRMIAVAGVAANLFITLAGLYHLRNRGDIFGLSLSHVNLRPFELVPLLRLSFPVVVEKISFSLGKVIVNSLASVYGPVTAGALGISNNIGGLVTMPQNGFQDGCSSVISQNYGAGHIDRALRAFKITMIFNLAIGGILCALTLVFVRPLASLFSPDNHEFAALISLMYSYEGFGTFVLAFNASVMSLLYGFGYTKLSLLINVCRLFVFRIPVVYLLQRYASLGITTIGYAMLFSNVSTGLFSLAVGLFVYARLKKNICHSLRNKPSKNAF